MNIFKTMPYEDFRRANGSVLFSNGLRLTFDLNKINKELYYAIGQFVFPNLQKVLLDTRNSMDTIDHQKLTFQLKNYPQLIEGYGKNLVIELFNLIKEANWEEVKGEQLHITNLEKIICPSYQNLIKLLIKSSQIQSIQAIGFLNAPLIQSLDLTDNKISNLKGLQKSLISNLRTLKIKGNKISEKELGRIKLKESLKFQYELRQNLLACGKLETKVLSNIGAQFNGQWLAMISSPYSGLLLAQSRNVQRVLKVPWSRSI